MKRTNEYRNQRTHPLPKTLFGGKWIITCMISFLAVASTGQNAISYLRASVKYDKPYELPVRNEISTPFEIIRGMIVMEAKMDHQSGQFILDTGAPLMVVNDHPGRPSRLAASFSQEMEVGETTIKAFNWAGTEEKSLDALVLDISHLETAFRRPIKGMIGYNALKRYEVFFDYEEKFLLRYNARKNMLHKNARPIYQIPFQLYDHLPVIVVQVGKRKLRFGLDTGACTNLIDQSVLESLDGQFLTALPDEEVQGLDQGVSLVKAVQVDGLSVKGRDVNDLKFLATDLQQLHSENGLALDGLLGFSFLSQMKFSINYPKQKIYVWE